MKRVLICALLMAWSGMSLAVVYKWVDAKGDVVQATAGAPTRDEIEANIQKTIGAGQ